MAKALIQCGNHTDRQRVYQTILYPAVLRQLFVAKLPPNLVEYADKIYMYGQHSAEKKSRNESKEAAEERRKLIELINSSGSDLKSQLTNFKGNVLISLLF